MFTNVSEVNVVKEELNEINQHFPDFYEKIEHVASLTRQLQIHYKYMGKLINDDENNNEPNPPFIRSSVLKVYIDEVKKLKSDSHFNELLNIFENHRNVEYSQIFLLVLGAKPDLVARNTIIK